MVARSLDRIWIGGTTTLILFIAVSAQLFVVWPQYGRELSVDLIKLLLPFNFLVFMVFWNYRLCVTTPPGSVPHGWRPNMSSLDGMEVKRGSHAPRYCKMCEHYKPPRTHHCRQCKTCVLKLDHHCPWIANCVGYHNQGHFLRFLFWVDLAASYDLFLIVNRIFDLSRMATDEPTLADVLFLIFNFAACAPVWVCVGMFSLYHLYLASGNTTTIERWEKDKVATLVRRGKIREIAYPYNIGSYKNLQAVLGPNPLLWLWPQPMPGDGLSFPVTPDAGGESAPHTWAETVQHRGGPLSVESSAGLGESASQSSAHLVQAERRRGSSREDVGELVSVQYAWPPSDPTRLTDPPRLDPSASPFIYGNNSLNPRLRPSSSRNTKHRDHAYSGTPSQSRAQLDSYSSGSERESSSPEPYLSDYDDAGWGPAVARDHDERIGLAGRRTHVREGSEGLEVRSVPAWQVPEWDDDVEGRVGARPWEEAGRYNVYEPQEDSGSDSDGDEWGTGPGPADGADGPDAPDWGQPERGSLEPRRPELKVD